MSISILMLCLASYIQCSEDRVVPNQTVLDYSDAIQIKAGNYWIYEVTSKNLQTGDVESLGTDSTTFSARMTKNDKEYLYYYNGNYALNGYLRDSSNYIVDSEGKIRFSGNNFSDTLYDLPDYYGKMTHVDSTVTVPAGTYKTVSFTQFSKKDPNYSTSQIYANNVGVVKIVTISDIEVIEYNLIRYHLE